MCLPAVDKPDGTACNDGDPCTRKDECRTGNCIGLDPLVCRTTKTCEISATCSRQSGQCELTVQAPTLQRPVGPIPQSDTIALKGIGLGGARVSLGGRILTLGPSSETHVTITIAADQPLGRSDLIVTTDCGEDRIPVDVIPHPPRIVSLDPTSPGPDGVVLIKAEFVDPAQLLSVQIDGIDIPTTDPSRFSWPNPANPKDAGLMGVRIPSSLTPGVVRLKLVSRTAESTPYDVQIRAVSGSLMSPTPTTVLFAPARAEDDEIFPLVRQGAPGPFLVRDTAPQPQGQWMFLWRFQDLGEAPTCLGTGRVGGYEKFCATGTACGPERECTAPAVCHPLTGTWQLNSGGNFIDLEIDRTSSGGIKERYRGAWRAADTGKPSIGVDGNLIMLRSLLTGRQISIAHQINRGGACNRRAYP
jgi:hypothetical protein